MPRVKKEKKVEKSIDISNITEEMAVGNAYLGAGRTPKALRFKNYEKAVKMFDDNIENAINQLVELMYDEDKYVRLRAIEIIIKKVIPDRKIKEVVGHDGGPIEIHQTSDMRSVVLNVVEALDSVDYDELKRRSLSGGSITVLGDDPRRESET